MAFLISDFIKELKSIKQEKGDLVVFAKKQFVDGIYTSDIRLDTNDIFDTITIIGNGEK